jgi:hypothetical protein
VKSITSDVLASSAERPRVLILSPVNSRGARDPSRCRRRRTAEDVAHAEVQQMSGVRPIMHAQARDGKPARERKLTEAVGRPDGGCMGTTRTHLSASEDSSPSATSEWSAERVH